jgi:hypothetical protein
MPWPGFGLALTWFRPGFDLALDWLWFCFGLVWLGLAWLGLVWLGLVLAWFGLAWFWLGFGSEPSFIRRQYIGEDT